MLKLLGQRFGECGLDLHPEKTKIVYCKDDRRTGNYHNTTFDVLGYTFRRRGCKDARANRMFLEFAPAVRADALKGMRRKIRQTRFRRRKAVAMNEVAD